MKLATLKGGRDGQLVLVSRDLTRFSSAANVAPTLQAALDDWSVARPQLEALAIELEAEDVGDLFSQSACASPYRALTSGPTVPRM